MNRRLVSPDLPTPYFDAADRRERILDNCAALELLFRRAAEQRHMPGVAYGILVDGELIFDHAFGVANVETGAPVSAETVFRIASMTKSFTALAILQLRDRGQLRLDDPIAAYVPEFANLHYPTADSSSITVRQLLTMSAGWPQDDPWGDRQLYRNDAEMSRFFEDGVSWSNPPGIAFEYSNYGYMVLGRIVTNVAGMPMIQYVDGEILRPLGMDATVWNAVDVPAERLAPGYRWEDEGWKAEPLLPSGGDVAAFAGIFTSIRDLARWVALFQSSWPPRNDEDEAILRRSSLREMQQNWRPMPPQIFVPALGAKPRLFAGGYGYGLFILHNGEWESVGHGGGLPGFGSHMRWSPAHGVGVIALTNLTYGNVSSVCGEGLEMLIRTSEVKPRARPVTPALEGARQGIIRLLEEWDDALADTLFAENFFLDQDREHWQQEWAALRERHGVLAPEGSLEVENWLRGQWRMTGEQGWCQISFTLSPTVPPRIQEMEFDSTLPPSPALQGAIEALLALIDRPTRRGVDRLTASSVDRAALLDQLRLVKLLCGSCQPGEITGGDGTSWARMKLIGSKQNLDVRLSVDERGKVMGCVIREA
ncbi:MAG: beta-lactamase family protein [Caldilineaceae bacterium]|nr:beta-lactamase family protein [Caldilineaceae bacterium]